MATLAAAVGSGRVSGTALPARADTATVREWPVPSPGFYSPSDLTRGPDGNVWFTEFDPHKIGRVTPAGKFTEFATTGGPTSITLGPDGNLWFLEPQEGLVGRLTPAGVLTEFPTGFSGFPQRQYGEITAGPDGNIWFTEESPGVSRITPSGTITTFAVPNVPTVITAGPDGNLWFGFGGGGDFPFIGRISPAGTNFTTFALPPSGNFIENAQVQGITAGPNGNVWFTTNVLVGEVSHNGTFTQFAIPTSGSNPRDITLGPDGNLWFTEINGDRIARLTPAGKISEVLMPSFDGTPVAITSANGKLWFTNPDVSRIGYLDPTTLAPPPGPCLVITHNTTLTHDVGPCAGDGIVVGANNVTLNLNGHKVFAAPGPRVGDFAGIHLAGVNGVTVRNGEVTGFDAGVWLDGGADVTVSGASNNTVAYLNVHDNRGAANQASKLGDGIVLIHAGTNRIVHNVVDRNGIFDGIGVLGLGSNNNTIEDNVVEHSTDLKTGAGFSFNPGAGTGILISSFLEVENLGRGQSLSGNKVNHNTVRHNISSGISSISNVDAQIQDNRLADNGFRPDGTQGNEPGNGIGLQANAAATPVTSNVVSRNVVDRSRLAGIEVLSDANTVKDNTFTNDAVGIYNHFGHSNTFTNNVATNGLFVDLYDATDYPTCDSDTWFANTYVTANPVCTTTGGHQISQPPTAAVAGASVQRPSSQDGPAQFARGRSVTGQAFPRTKTG